MITRVRRVVIHPAAWPRFQAWAANVELTLTRLPEADTDGVETWEIGAGRAPAEDWTERGEGS